MVLKKEKLVFIYKAKTLETFHSLSNNPQWVSKLLETDHIFNDFLSGLLENIFFQSEARLSLKQIAINLEFDVTKITKWIKDIYDDTLMLNEDNPEKFKATGVEHICFFSNYENRQSFSLWLSHTPRLYEYFELPFLSAKLGTYSFLVTEVSHTLDDSG